MSKNIYKEIAVENLKLDLDNPRLPKSKQGKDESEVIKFMLLQSATLELMMAIGENDFFAGEQLLVVEGKSDKGKYTVIEGNRRLTAVKLLSNPKLSEVKKESIKQICEEAEFKPTKVPCLVFNEKQEILKYLGFRHITGIKSWKLLQKARYLSELKEREFNTVPYLDACRNIAKSIGATYGAHINRLLTSYELYKIVEDEGFYSIDNLNDTNFHLNYFNDALNKTNILNFLGINLNSDSPLDELNKENLKKLIFWWFQKFEGKSRALGTSKELKMLDKILSNNNALMAFENGESIDIAYELTNDMDVIFKKEVEKSLNAMEQADAYSNKVKGFYPNLFEDLKSIRAIANKINNYQQQKENEDDF